MRGEVTDGRTDHLGCEEDGHDGEVSQDLRRSFGFGFSFEYLYRKMRRWSTIQMLPETERRGRFICCAVKQEAAKMHMVIRHRFDIYFEKARL